MRSQKEGDYLPNLNSGFFWIRMMLGLRVGRTLDSEIGTLSRQCTFHLSCTAVFNDSVTGRLRDLRSTLGRAPTVVSGNGHPRYLILMRDCHLQICSPGLFFFTVSVTLG
jgi:hypothetical protein